jgi:hypothetical protein
MPLIAHTLYQVSTAGVRLLPFHHPAVWANKIASLDAGHTSLACAF